MDWYEVEVEGPGPKMLFPMAWSLLPLIAGMITFINHPGLIATSLLSLGIMISCGAVYLGSQKVPGLIDMMVLIISPFSAFILFFQPPIIAQITIAIIVWIVNYRAAAMLSLHAGSMWRCEWDPSVPLPHVDGAIYFTKRWAARPLMRINGIILKGVRDGDKVLLECPVQIHFSR
jgi:hypothetical protein